MNSIDPRSASSGAEQKLINKIFGVDGSWQAIVQGAIDLYHMVRERLRPTPATAHYVFTLHDFAHILEGIMLMSPRSKAKPKPKLKKKEEKQDAKVKSECV